MYLITMPTVGILKTLNRTQHAGSTRARAWLPGGGPPSPLSPRGTEAPLWAAAGDLIRSDNVGVAVMTVEEVAADAAAAMVVEAEKPSSRLPGVEQQRRRSLRSWRISGRRWTIGGRRSSTNA